MKDEKSYLPRLRTKLHRPPVAEDHLHRTRLLERLNKRIHRPLTLVSAPAGYGKSTLVSCWLEACDLPSVWISLDESDNDLRMFLAYILAGVQRIFPEHLREIQSMLNNAELPILQILARSLINELDKINKNFILVLDDYHVIHDKVVNKLVIELIKHSPSSMHLVLAARRDPSIPLAKYRARGQMTEIRTQDLRFTVTETAEFLQSMLDEPLDDATVATLDNKTEGWVTGLRLVALSFRHREDLERISSNLPDNNHYVMEYVIAEVLSQQPLDIQEYLLATSILDRFCTPLFDALYVSIASSEHRELHGKEIIEWIEKNNLFIIPLDDEHQWFRYHHLFQGLLQRLLKRRFGQDSIDELHIHASRWFAQNGLIEEALQHALRGGDTAAAARLVAKNRHDLMNREQWSRLERLIKVLPSEIVEKDGELLLTKAWLCENRARSAETMEVLKRLEPLLAAAPSKKTTAWKRLMAEVDALNSFRYYLEGDGQQAVIHGERALKNLNPRAYSVRGWAVCLLAAGYQMTGDLKSAYEVVYDGFKDEVLQTTSYHSRLFVTLCLVQWIAADLTGLRQAASQALKLGKDANLQETISIASYSLGIVHFMRNELPEADQYLNDVVKNTYDPSILNYSHSAFALALSHQAQSRIEASREVAKEVINRALDAKNTEMLQNAEAFQAELDLRQGNISRAKQWARNYDPQPFHPGYRFYLPQLTLAKVLLKLDDKQSRHRAGSLLSQLHEYYAAIHNTRFLIDVLSLQALLYDARGEESAAVGVLENALTLAEPGGFVRPFLDLGPQMADLLNRMGKQNIAVKYVGKLLSDFREERAKALPTASDVPGDIVSPTSPPTLVDSLTNREFDVLTFLSQRMSNKEIAEKLFISPLTVKKHSMNIYSKLNVNSRQQAVEKARALGII